MRVQYQCFCAGILFMVINLFNTCLCFSQGQLISRWAEKLGKELWDLGKVVTNRQDIENNYKIVNLETKDPKKLIAEIVGNVSYMMNKKVEAVQCIREAAEIAAFHFNLNDTDRNYTYYRSNPPELYDDDVKNPDPEMYLNMTLNEDTHFFNLFVNTHHSSVHVPINVYHKHDIGETAIKWSEELDDIFQRNYGADPALSWQYFGSSTGIMRHYPAMEWGPQDKGLFDCRIRTWFIEAATCTKDVVILLDNSGSMEGMHKHIASLTVNTILDTLSNNDYINIMNYSETVNYTVPCFKNVIVQATEENIIVLKDSLKPLIPGNKSLVELALRDGFDLLYQYRNESRCKYCNQAIMLITDGMQTNLSDIINEYNTLQNQSSNPIRIFTFLIGKEATDHLDAAWISCNNRGYYSHVDALEQVTSAVYKYVLVCARPLVLQSEDHPASWTHAYYDDTYKFLDSSKRGRKKYRLLTTVAVPAFDLKANEDPNKKSAELLGVAGTDVPLEEIEKLMYLYKTGVNSHSFIVSNNGYVLKHPDLRPMFEETLKDNYNSIDLTEVEQLDDDSGPREVMGQLEELRNALVQWKEGVIHDIKIKYHYDDMRRVSREVNDYYFAPIKGTPFSIGFAIPDLYGNYSIEVGDPIGDHKYSHIKISSFFEGENWKIQPRWVYCKYHYQENHEFDSPEKEFQHFVKEMVKDENFNWSMQYEVNPTEAEPGENKSNCGSTNLHINSFYCDKNLVQRLVFDAKNTKPAFDQPWTATGSIEDQLRLRYKATLRFVATMSGLTRWEYISENKPDPGESTFGDTYPRAIAETWYKSAVIQHRYNDHSFVYAVPFDSAHEEDLLVTASFAIFPNKDGIAAPGAVVGFQFSHSRLTQRFFNITTVEQQKNLPCETIYSSSGLACYVVDNSGYIIVSKDKEDTGKFFGEEDGNIMEALIRENIFEKVTIRDYQAICYYYEWVNGSSNALVAPFHYLIGATKWMFSQFLWTTFKTCIYQLWDSTWTLENDLQNATTTSTTPKPTSKCGKKCNDDEERWHQQNKIPKYHRTHTACEKERDLYILQQQNVADLNLYPEEVPTNFTRPFYIRMIPNSNLLLIAIKNNERKTKPPYYSHTTRIRDIVYGEKTVFPCQKLYLNGLNRRPLQGCYNEHPDEKEINACGKSRRIYLSKHLMAASVAVYFIPLISRNVNYN